MDKSGHLFICYTPLHVLIAKKIIKEENLRSFVLVYYYTNDNEKTRYYYAQLSSLANRAYYVHKKNAAAHTLKTLISLVFILRKYLKKAPIIYTGNVKTIYSRFLIVAFKSRQLHTFDDGVGNVSGKGYFYNGRTSTIFSKAASLLGQNFAYSSVYKLIARHYTIYETENVMPHARHIKVFDFQPGLAQGAKDEEVAVFLTTTLFEEGHSTLALEKTMYGRIIHDFKVRYVIPHPLEVHNKCEGEDVIILKSEKIAEEIIMDLLKQFKQVKVVGWYSSALIHLAKVPGIEAVNVYFDSALGFDGPREFFESLGVRTYTLKVN